MGLVALQCPACAGPLPLSARWLGTLCRYCGASVVVGARKVEVARYEQALQALETEPQPGEFRLRLGGWRLEVLGLLGSGPRKVALLVRRCRALSPLMVLKLPKQGEGVGEPDGEWEGLSALGRSEAQGASTFSRRLPGAVARGEIDGLGTVGHLLSFSPGFDLNLAQIWPVGGSLDAQHLVWMGRRALEALGFVHRSGWLHGGICRENLLIHPRDHGVMLIGWSHCRRLPHPEAARADLRAVGQSLLSTGAHCPAILHDWLSHLGDPRTTADAWEAHQELKTLGQGLYGPPRYLALRLEASIPH